MSALALPELAQAVNREHKAAICAARRKLRLERPPSARRRLRAEPFARRCALARLAHGSYHGHSP